MSKVSIIVPVWNVEKYLSKCLDSLINQTLKDIEIIVINDDSPDNSQMIIDEYVKKHPKKIKSYIKENGGQGSARNFGLENATGEYILYVDSDDYIEYDMAEKLYKSAKDNNSVVVVCGNKVVDEDGNIVSNESAFSYNDKNDVFLNLLFGKMAVWNKLYKKSLIVESQLKFRSKIWYEDLDFTSKIIFSIDPKKVSFVDEYLYNYLLRNGSTMNNKNVTRNLELCLSFDELINYTNNKKIYKENYSELEFLCIYHMYIFGISRISQISIPWKDKKIIINKFIKYINDNFPDYKNNKYLKFLSRNRKITYKLIQCKLYFVIKFIFDIKNIRM